MHPQPSAGIAAIPQSKGRSSKATGEHRCDPLCGVRRKLLPHFLGHPFRTPEVHSTLYAIRSIVSTFRIVKHFL